MKEKCLINLTSDIDGSKFYHIVDVEVYQWMNYEKVDDVKSIYNNLWENMDPQFKKPNYNNKYELFLSEINNKPERHEYANQLMSCFTNKKQLKQFIKSNKITIVNELKAIIY